MKASELRIGNYILFSEDNTIFEVGSIEEKGFTVQNKEETTWIEAYQFEPITLTEEWLLKFGFQKNGCYYISEETNIEFYLTNGKLYCELHGETIFNIENVHQLQNLYFALSGGELTIK